MAEQICDIHEAFLLSLDEYPDFWKNYARIFEKPNPCDLPKRPVIDALIDKATGYEAEIWKDAIDFFMEYVVIPMGIEKIKQEIIND